MKARFESNFEYGKKLGKYLIVAAVVLLVLSLFVPEGQPVKLISVLLAIVSMVSACVSIYHYCRCPYCGKHIMFGVLRVKACPSCNRNLTTGKKAKKNER